MAEQEENDISVEDIVTMIQKGQDRERNTEKLCKLANGLIYKVARSYKIPSLVDDLAQEGFEAVLEAVPKFDAGQGAKFFTFAWHDIIRRMRLFLRSSVGLVLSPSIADEVQRYKRISADIEARTGREPTEIEIALEMGLTSKYLDWRKKVRALRRAALNPASLDAPMYEDGPSLGEQQAADDDPEQEAIDAVFSEELKAVWDCVDTLPEDQAEIIRCRYGHGLTMGQTAEATNAADGVATVRSTEQKALRALRTGSRKEKLLPFYEAIYGSAMRGTGVGNFYRTWTSATERTALRILGCDD